MRSINESEDIGYFREKIIKGLARGDLESVRKYGRKLDLLLIAIRSCKKHNHD